jgi:hypothetical protein
VRSCGCCNRRSLASLREPSGPLDGPRVGWRGGEPEGKPARRSTRQGSPGTPSGAGAVLLGCLVRGWDGALCQCAGDRSGAAVLGSAAARCVNRPRRRGGRARIASRERGGWPPAVTHASAVGAISSAAVCHSASGRTSPWCWSAWSRRARSRGAWAGRCRRSCATIESSDASEARDELRAARDRAGRFCARASRPRRSRGGCAAGSPSMRRCVGVCRNDLSVVVCTVPRALKLMRYLQIGRTLRKLGRQFGSARAASATRSTSGCCGGASWVDEPPSGLDSEFPSKSHAL